MIGVQWALANWKYILIAALVVYGGWQHMEVLSLEKAAIEDQLAAEKAVNAARLEDAEHTAALEAKYIVQIQGIQEAASGQQIAIATAPRSNVCLGTAAARAFIDGLQSDADKAHPAKP